MGKKRKAKINNNNNNNNNNKNNNKKKVESFDGFSAVGISTVLQFNIWSNVLKLISFVLCCKILVSRVR